MPLSLVVGWFFAGVAGTGLCAATGFLVPYTLACAKSPHDKFSASYHALLVVLVAPVSAIIGGAMAVAAYAFDANPWPLIAAWGFASAAIQVAAVLGDRWLNRRGRKQFPQRVDVVPTVRSRG